MHESVMQWVGEQVGELPRPRKGTLGAVLEVGSFDVNGSVRPLFADAKQYVGIDHEAGRGVDQTADACELPFPDNHFHVVVSTEMLEHCLRPWRAVAEMGRVCRARGRLILTCRGFNESGAFPFHNPPDHWRMSAMALATMCADAGFTDVTTFADPQVPGWFVVAVKQ